MLIANYKPRIKVVSGIINHIIDDDSIFFKTIFQMSIYGELIKGSRSISSTKNFVPAYKMSNCR